MATPVKIMPPIDTYAKLTSNVAETECGNYAAGTTLRWQTG